MENRQLNNRKDSDTLKLTFIMNLFNFLAGNTNKMSILIAGVVQKSSDVVIQIVTPISPCFITTRT